MLAKCTVALCALLMTSCASILSKSTYPVTFDTNPRGAHLVIRDKNGGAMFDGNAPTTITGTALDLCRVAGQRVTAESTDLVGVGPDAADPRGGSDRPERFRDQEPHSPLTVSWICVPGYHLVDLHEVSR